MSEMSEATETAATDSAATDSAATPEDLIGAGRKLLRAREIPAAVNAFDRAIEGNPHSVEARELRAKCAFLQKDYDKAAKHFERAAKCDTSRVTPLVNLGAVQNVQKDYAKAIKTLQKAVTKRAGRTNAEAYYNLGIAYRGSGQATMAVQAYREAIRLNSDFAEAHQNLGNAYLDQKNTRQAKASFTRALELKPNLKGAIRGMERCNAGGGRTAADPFGGHTQSAGVTQQTIALSETARINDRATLQDLSAKIETSLLAWAGEVKTVVEPAIRATVKSISGSVDLSGLNRAAGQIEMSVSESTAILSVLEDAVAAIRDHENDLVEQANQTDAAD